MTRPAGRGDDPDQCPNHGFGWQKPDDHKVRVNGKLLVSASAPIVCGGCNDFVVTGSGTVALGGQPVAGQADKTMHGGHLATGSGNVLIGGPTVGAVLGGPTTAKAACEAMGADRPGGHLGQTYGNCGIESVRLIVNQAKQASHTEAELYGHAVENKHASSTEYGFDKEKGFYYETLSSHRDSSGNLIVDGVTPHWTEFGGTTVDGRHDLLNEYGVKVENEWQTVDGVAQAVAEGKGVITMHNVDFLWDGDREKSARRSGSHAINVTGVAYNPDGSIKGFYTADTGLGDCCRFVPVGYFEESTPLLGRMTVTSQRIWLSKGLGLGKKS